MKPPTPINVTILKKNPNVCNFQPTILSPETAAPISWANGMFWFVLQETTMSTKSSLLVGGILCSGGRAGPILFMGAGICLNNGTLFRRRKSLAIFESRWKSQSQSRRDSCVRGALRRNTFGLLHRTRHENCSLPLLQQSQPVCKHISLRSHWLQQKAVDKILRLAFGV